MPKARRVGHRRRRPSAYEQAGLAKVTGDGPFLRNVSIFGTAFKGVVACNKSSTRLIAASKPLRCTVFVGMGYERLDTAGTYLVPAASGAAERTRAATRRSAIERPMTDKQINDAQLLL